LTWPDTNAPAGASTTLQHHLLHPYRAYPMVWRQLIWCHDCLCHEFWIRFAGKVPNFEPNAVQKFTQPDTIEPAGASTTMQHHLLDPSGAYPMVWRQLIWCHDCLCHEFWIRFAG
jgi:hypothetical protein